MKKITSFLLLIALAFSVNAQHTTPRLGNKVSDCSNFGCVDYKYSSVTTTTATAVLYQLPRTYESVIKIGTLTHALTDSLGISGSFVGDKVTFVFAADTLTAGRVVTFGNNIKSAGTLTVPNSKSSHSGQASISFIFDGVRWTELYRSINTN